jgi:phosphate transport system substrate-binding protein
MSRRCLISWAVVALGATCAQAQTRDALDVQRAVGKSVTSRGKQVFYTKKWNLDDLPRYSPEQNVSATIRMWGNSCLRDGFLAQYWEEGFHRYHPAVAFKYDLYTTLHAIAGLYTGVADLGSSRRINWDELMGFQRRFGYDPLEIVAATGSFNVLGWNVTPGVLVHKDNPISRLTLKQVDGIFGAARDGGWQGTTWHPELGRSASENIRTWGQLGLTGDWKDENIHVYGLNLKHNQCGHFELRVFNGGHKWNENLREYTNHANLDGTIVTAAQQMMEDLGKDRYGIGWSGIQDLTPRTKAVALAARDGGPYVELTIDNVQNRTYPLFDEVYFYVNREPGKAMAPEVKEYLRYVLSREGQEAVARDGKYLPLPGEVVREQLKKLE